MNSFLDLPQSPLETADVVLVPLPFEATVSYAAGTAAAPAAIWEATAQVEFWDEELEFDLAGLKYHTTNRIEPQIHEPPESYLLRVERTARELHRQAGLVIGIGGEHSLTPSLLSACCQPDADYNNLTVIQFDAHADLRTEFEGTSYSHACAMRPLVERRANLLAIGIRSADKEEYQFGQSTGRVQTFFARQLATHAEYEQQLISTLQSLSGQTYLTFDIDALEVHLCPATGTPQPGGLGWWQALHYLKTLLLNPQLELIGCDIVETAPMPNSRVNEMTAAKLLCKILAYHFARNPLG